MRAVFLLISILFMCLCTQAQSLDRIRSSINDFLSHDQLDSVCAQIDEAFQSRVLMTKEDSSSFASLRDIMCDDTKVSFYIHQGISQFNRKDIDKALSF